MPVQNRIVQYGRLHEFELGVHRVEQDDEDADDNGRDGQGENEPQNAVEPPQGSHVGNAREELCDNHHGHEHPEEHDGEADDMQHRLRYIDVLVQPNADGLREVIGQIHGQDYAHEGNGLLQEPFGDAAYGARDEEDEEDGYSPMKSLAESIVYQDKAAEIMRAEEALRAAEAAAVEAQRAADIAKHFVEEARLRANMIKGISTSKTVLGKGTKFEGMTLDEVRQQLDEEERIYERNRRAEEEKNASPSQSKKSQPDSIDSDSKIEIFEFDKSKEGKGKRIGDELTKTAEIDIDEIKINLADGNNIYNTANIQQALAKCMAKLMSESNDETEENPMTAQDSDRNDTVGSHEAAESLQ